MNQRAFSILIFLSLAAALLAQCRTLPQEGSTTLTGVDDDGSARTLFFNAASLGKIDAMESAVAHGANVNATNSFTWTPLMIAVFYDQQSSVRWLMEHGADVNASSDTGVTPLLEAARVGDQRVLDELINAGANICATDTSGRNALIFAIEGFHGANVLRDLLTRGLPPDATDDDGETPLMDAIQSGNVQLAEILVAHGANLRATDRAGRTVLDYGQTTHDDAVIAFLSIAKR